MFLGANAAENGQHEKEMAEMRQSIPIKIGTEMKGEEKQVSIKRDADSGWIPYCEICDDTGTCFTSQFELRSIQWAEKSPPFWFIRTPDIPEISVDGQITYINPARFISVSEREKVAIEDWLNEAKEFYGNQKG